MKTSLNLRSCNKESQPFKKYGRLISLLRKSHAHTVSNKTKRQKIKKEIKATIAQ